MINSAIWQRKELGAAGLVFLVAIVGVIINLLVGSILVIMAPLARRWRIAAQALAGIAGLAALVVGLLLLIPVGAFAAHGPALAGARAAMALAAAGDFAASALALAAAGILPRFGSVVRQLVQDVRTHRRVGRSSSRFGLRCWGSRPPPGSVYCPAGTRCFCYVCCSRSRPVFWWAGGEASPPCRPTRIRSPTVSLAAASLARSSWC